MATLGLKDKRTDHVLGGINTDDSPSTCGINFSPWSTPNAHISGAGASSCIGSEPVANMKSNALILAIGAFSGVSVARELEPSAELSAWYDTGAAHQESMEHKIVGNLTL